MRKCPFHGCAVRLPDALFACKKHWFALNLAERTEIYRAYDDYLNDRIDLAELRRCQQAVLGDRGQAEPEAMRT